MTQPAKKQKGIDIANLAPRQLPRRDLSAVEIMASLVVTANLAPQVISQATEVQHLAEGEPIAEPTLSLGVQLDERNFGLYVEHAALVAPAQYTQQRAGFRWRAVAPQLATFVAVALVVLGSIQGAKIFASTLTTRSLVLGATTSAIAHLQSAQSLIGQSNVAGSQQQLELAEQGFSQAQQNLQGFGGLLNGVLLASPQGRSASNLIDAGSAVTAAGQQLASFYSLGSQLSVNGSGVSAGQGQGNFATTVASAAAYLSAAHDDVKLASQDIQQVDPSSLPQQYQAAFAQYSAQLPVLADTLSDASGAVGMFSSLVGPGPKSILVLFENNNELRPGGGFIGTYGFFKFNSGQIESQQISSVYDLDGQLATTGKKVAPPGPFYTATDSWGLRDSNWFADFSQSAKKASSFYEETGGETPDSVVAITPDVFVDLLKITGPIDFPKYSLTLTAANFRDVVQENTSDQASAAPKQMLSDFAPLLMQHIASLPSSDGAAVLGVLIQNLADKNILLYSSDPTVEAQLAQYNWAGTIAQTAQTGSDYLNIVNANIGGEKTDLSVSQAASLASAVQPDGSIVDTLTYTRTRPQDPAAAGVAAATSSVVNTDYARFLVPSGSVLVSATGFTKEPYRKSDGSAYTWESPSSFTVDSNLAAIDATASVDPATGTVTEREAGKTEFANWIDVAAGQSATVTLVYRLPFKVGDADTYSLTVQKQPGNNPINFSYTFAPGRQITWYTPSDLESSAIQAGTVQYSAPLTSDIFIGELFHG